MFTPRRNIARLFVPTVGVEKELAGTITAACTVGGALKVQKKFTGTITTASVVTGNLTVAFGLSDYSELKLLELIVGKTGFSTPTVYVAVSTTSPLEDGSGITEPSGLNYSRVATVGADWGNAANGEIANVENITFPEASGDWGLIAYYALFDAISGGNMLVYDALDTPKSVNSAELVQFAADELKITLD